MILLTYTIHWWWASIEAGDTFYEMTNSLAGSPLSGIRQESEAMSGRRHNPTRTGKADLVDIARSAFQNGLGVSCDSASSCFDSFSYPPVVCQHCEQVTPLHFLAEDGAHGEGVEGPNKFMKAALIVPNSCRVAAVSICP